MAAPHPPSLAVEAREALLRELRERPAPGGGLPVRARELLGRVALDEMFELVALLAPDGTLLELNERAVVVTGARRAAAGEFVRDEIELAAPDRAAGVTLDYSFRPVKHRGAVAFIVAEGRDVTAMRRARDAVQRELADHAADAERLADELGRRKRELETALDAMRFAREQADRASAQKTSLLRMVSHELRTPLAALLLQVDRLRRDAAELSPHHRDAVGRMRSAMTRLSSLVDSLLEYSRIETGRVTVAPARLDPAAVAGEVVHELEPLAAGKGLSVSCPPPGSAPALETDPRLLRLVLFNLVHNAIKFTDRGSVAVSIAVEDGEHRITVLDTGRGIAPEDQGRIFEPFEQLEAIARKHTPGIGLGLALVREMVGVLDGRIALESRPGAGSTFTVSIPSRRKPAGREARAEAAAER